MATKVKVAILDDYQGVAFSSADWSGLNNGIEITVFKDTLRDEKEIINRLLPFEIICAMRERTKFPRTLLTQLSNLRLIATTGMRNLGIDVKAAKELGIVVSGTSSGGDSTLEHIWALILATARHVVHEDAATKAGDSLWQHTIPIGLQGKTLGLIGLGRLGQSTAKIAKVFGMNVVAWSPHLTRERAEAAGVTFIESKSEIFRVSDILSVHIVLSLTTKGMITREDLNQMKSTAIFINTSRGPLVDESALCEALEKKKIAAAGLDVFDLEPLPLDHPLRKLPNITLSPHMGYVSDDNYKAFWGDTVDNIKAYMNGTPKRVLQ